jgi:MarR family transcriptional regulator, organic hydroperoxide resistance regulator
MSEKVAPKTVAELRELFREIFLSHPSLGDLVSAVNEHDLNLPQIITLDLVARGPQTVSSVSKLLRLTPGATSRLVDRLVRRKLLDRREEGDDRRKKVLSLTPTGSRVHARLESARAGGLAGVLSVLDPASASELRTILRRLLEALRSRESSASTGVSPRGRSRS